MQFTFIGCSMEDAKADIIRKQYAYRRAVMKGKIKLPVPAAVRLIGPDCAYHLYSTFGGNGTPDGGNDPDKKQKA
jgi:hypothetical protein